MAAGPRSLLAFWAGGAGATASETLAGVRGLLAPWIGGASAEPADTGAQGGVRSLLAPWIGGAGAATTTEQQAAVRSLLAFWLGGASAGVAPAPAPAPPIQAGRRVVIPPELVERMRRHQIEEDEVITMVLLAALPGLLRRQ
jgi:hypothetical protein